MAGWPTVSKGIFYTGFNKAKSEGPSAGDRPNSKVAYPSGAKKSVIHKEEATNTYTQQKAQKPLG